MNGLLVAATFTLLVTGVAAQQGSGGASVRPRPAPRVLTRPPAPAAIRAVGTVRDVMIGIIEPSSGLVFDAASNTPQQPEHFGLFSFYFKAFLVFPSGHARNFCEIYSAPWMLS
jgi:hypothetical protein